MVDKNRHVKLIDFGFAAAIKDNIKFYEFCGTPPFAAPELLTAIDSKPFTDKSDMYAYSIMIYMLYTQKNPYPGEDENGIYRRAIANLRPSIPSTCPIEIAKLIRFCWMDKPEDRYSATQAVGVLEKLKQFSPAKKFWEKRIEIDNEVKMQQ